jgi:hypothetical protein
MSYIRGKYYTWSDGEYMHLPEEMPEDMFDELVVMRYAEIEEDGDIKDVENRAINNWGNFGCDSLRKKHGLETSLEKIKRKVKDTK